MSAPSLDDFAHQQILGFAIEALRKAGVYGVIPTPLGAVGRAAGITQILDMSAMPPELAHQKPDEIDQVLGALVYHEHLIFIDRTQAPARARLTHAHEIAHRILPWHRRAFQFDGTEYLRGETLNRLEVEAFEAAAHLLFQGPVFQRLAAQRPPSIKSGLALAAAFGSSRHAALRYYAERHPAPAALLIAGVLPDAGGRVPIWRSVESEPFRHQFGSLLDRFPTGVLRVGEQEPSVAGRLARRAMASEEVASRFSTIRDLEGVSYRFLTEAFFNHYNLFLMVVGADGR